MDARNLGKTLMDEIEEVGLDEVSFQRQRRIAARFVLSTCLPEMSVAQRYQCSTTRCLMVRMACIEQCHQIGL
jgi:hypothetical protein